MQDGTSTAVHCCYLLVLFLPIIHDPQEQSLFKNTKLQQAYGLLSYVNRQNGNTNDVVSQSVINVTNIMPEVSCSLVKKRNNNFNAARSVLFFFQV
jgi:hypothetical protein